MLYKCIGILFISVTLTVSIFHKEVLGSVATYGICDITYFNTTTVAAIKNVTPCFCHIHFTLCLTHFFGKHFDILIG